MNRLTWQINITPASPGLLKALPENMRAILGQDKKPEKSGAGAIAGVISAIGTMLLPFALVYFGHIYKESEEKQGIHERYVQMAVEILKAESSHENRKLRAWAVEVLHEYSEVPIHVEAKDFLLNNSVKLDDEEEIPDK